MSVLSTSSAIHWRTAVTQVVSTRVDVWRRPMQSMPTIVFPAPHGSTITPEPPCSEPWTWKASDASLW